MKTDIVIRVYDGDLKSRLTMYSGTTCHHEEIRLGKQMYRMGAFLPHSEIRSPNSDELNALEDGGCVVGRNQVIGIARLSISLLNDLRAAKVEDGKIQGGAVHTYPFTELTLELAPKWIIRGPLIALGYATNPSGFLTVTFDAAASRFIGLHIDDLDELPIERRQESTTRLCVNLGQHSRYLLFINVSTLTMARMLANEQTGGPYMRMRSTPLIHAFLNAFPEYPVARLEIRPGEAYIAPTENMIHDGSTVGMSGSDHQITLRGIIDPGSGN